MTDVMAVTPLRHVRSGKYLTADGDFVLMEMRQLAQVVGRGAGQYAWRALPLTHRASQALELAGVPSRAGFATRKEIVKVLCAAAAQLTSPT